MRASGLKNFTAMGAVSALLQRNPVEGTPRNRIWSVRRTFRLWAKPNGHTGKPRNRFPFLCRQFLAESLYVQAQTRR